MKWIGWAICIIGINMLITGFMGGMNWIAVIAGLLVAIFSAIGALKG